jgi:hypothetical protein
MTDRREHDANRNPYREQAIDARREARALELLDAEYAKENMNNMAVEGLQGGFFNRRDRAAVRAIMAALS